LDCKGAPGEFGLIPQRAEVGNDPRNFCTRLIKVSCAEQRFGETEASETSLEGLAVVGEGIAPFPAGCDGLSRRLAPCPGSTNGEFHVLANSDSSVCRQGGAKFAFCDDDFASEKVQYGGRVG
jgi:hypothetical protein